MPLVELSDVLKAVEAEPELPGTPGEYFLGLLVSVFETSDLETKLDLLRAVVRQTKSGITTRLWTLPQYSEVE